MEAQICEGDGISRKSAQEILRPEEDVMRYMIAILQNWDRHDVMGRSRRVTRVINYSETRTYTRNTTEISGIGRDAGSTQNTSQWGWRLYEEIKRW